MPKKILVVEDSDDVREYMKVLLELYDYEVSEAINGEEAVNIVKQNPPDLILMDMAMPVMNGITATKIIRESNDATKLPIVAVTALIESYYRIAIEAGCNDLIAKPVDFNGLKSILNRYL